MIDTVALKRIILNLAISGKLSERKKTDSPVSEKLKLYYPNNRNELNDIPNEWKYCKFGDVLINRDSERIPISITDRKKLSKVYNYYGASGVIDKVDKYLFSEKLLLIGEDGANLISRNVPIAFIADGKYWVNNHAHVLGATEYIVLEYAEIAINAISLVPYVTGSAQPKLSQNMMNKIALPIPPIEEQQRIVNRVKQIFNILDNIDKLQENYNYNLNVLKNKVIDAGVQGKLTEQLLEDGNAEDLYDEIQKEKSKLIEEGKIKKEKNKSESTDDEIPFEIPDNWKWVRLGDLSSKISSGNTPAGGKKAKVYVEQGYCFFREQNIYNDGIHEEGLVYITEELLNTRVNSTVLPKDILLNITGGSIGRCALIPDDFTKGSVNQHILIIRMVDPRLSFFVHSYLCSPQGQKYIKGNSVGDKDGFSATRCKNMLIPLPPIEEQNRIVTNLNAFLNCIN